MVKVFWNNKIHIIDKAYLRIGKDASVNYLDVCNRKLPSSQFALHVFADIYDRDIVRFIDADGIAREGIVLKNAYYTTVIECPETKKKYGLRKYQDSVEYVDTALNPNCKEEYKRYKNFYTPISSVRFELAIGRRKIPCTLTENFRIEIATGALISNIKLSDYGDFPEKRIPISVKAGNYVQNYGHVHVKDIVKFTASGSKIGVIEEDLFGAYIMCGDETLSIVQNACLPVGNLLFGDDVESFVDAAETNESEATPVDTIDVYTDGSAATNPGPCGYAYMIVSSGDVIRKESKYLGEGTNNIAELTAIKDALLDAAKDSPRVINIISDSKYCVDGITKWSSKWRKNGYKNADGKDIANKDLWQDVMSIVDTVRHKSELQFAWVKGHSENMYNKECDKLAKDAIANVLN